MRSTSSSARRRKSRRQRPKRESAPPFSIGEYRQRVQRVSSACASASRSATCPPTMPSTRAGGMCDFVDHLHARAVASTGTVGKCFERERQQAVTRENRVCLAEFLVTSGLAAPQVVVVERGQIIVNQRIRVNKFERARRAESRPRHQLRKNSRSFQAEHRPQPFSARENAVTHRLMDAKRLRVAPAAAGVPAPLQSAGCLLRKMSGIIADGVPNIAAGAEASQSTQISSPAFGLKRLRHHFAAGFFHQDFYAAFGLVKLLLAIARKRNAFFKQLHRFIEREIRVLQLACTISSRRAEIAQTPASSPPAQVSLRDWIQLFSSNLAMRAKIT